MQASGLAWSSRRTTSTAISRRCGACSARGGREPLHRDGAGARLSIRRSGDDDRRGTRARHRRAAESREACHRARSLRRERHGSVSPITGRRRALRSCSRSPRPSSGPSARSSARRRLRSASRRAAIAEPQQTTGVPRASVAVMPLANPTGDPSLRYLGDGIAGAHLRARAREGLTVPARTSSFAYRDRDVDVRRSRAISASRPCSKAVCDARATPARDRAARRRAHGVSHLVAELRPARGRPARIAGRACERSRPVADSEPAGGDRRRPGASDGESPGLSALSRSQRARRGQR